MDLKKILKTIKLHEQEINVLAGIIILAAAGIFVVNYIKGLKTVSNNQTTTPPVQVQSLPTHAVVKGETLWSISEKYYNSGFEWKKIAEANNITEPTRLEVGQNLIIPLTQPTPVPTATTTTLPSVNPKPTPQITAVAAATNVNNAISDSSYTVVKGDCLWTIAVRAYGDGSKWILIAQANKLQNPRIIHSGNVFMIPR